MLKNKNILFLAVTVGISLAPSAFADCANPAQQTSPPSSSTACMYLMGAGSKVLTNVYVGPYSASIDGGTPTQVICDDFLDDSFLPEYWTANVFDGGNSATYGSTRNATKAPLPAGFDLTAAYNEIGYLAVQLLTPGLSQEVTGEIHFALWSIFDPGAINTLDSYYGVPVGMQHNSYYNAANAWLTDAKSKSSDSSFISQFTIYSPDTSAAMYCPGNSCGSTRPPQEFLVRTPEPSFVAMLGVDLTGVGALIFMLRRRRSRQ
jgi:hypothetical protein